MSDSWQPDSFSWWPATLRSHENPMMIHHDTITPHWPMMSTPCHDAATNPALLPVHFSFSRMPRRDWRSPEKLQALPLFSFYNTTGSQVSKLDPYPARKEKNPQADLLFIPGGVQCSAGSQQLPHAAQPAESWFLKKPQETRCSCQWLPYPTPPYHLTLDSLLRDPKFCTPHSNTPLPYLNSPLKHILIPALLRPIVFNLPASMVSIVPQFTLTITRKIYFSFGQSWGTWQYLYYQVYQRAISSFSSPSCDNACLFPSVWPKWKVNL